MFYSTESALKWAFQVHTIDVVKSSSVNTMWCKTRYSSNNDLLTNLSRIDVKMQAENIIGAVYQLADNDIACCELIMAEYSREFNDNKINNVMLRVMSALGSGELRRRGIRDIVLTYFGVRIGVRKIREDLQCCSNDVSKYKTNVFDTMDYLRNKAIYLLQEDFVSKGIVRDRNTASISV